MAGVSRHHHQTTRVIRNSTGKPRRTRRCVCAYSPPEASDSGERWALVSLRNDAGGQRILRDDYLVAEFANSDRRHASNLEGSFAAGEQQRKMAFFGYHRFPILRVFTQQ